MSEKWDEIFETLKKRCVHICFLQAVKWKGQVVNVIENDFKFLRSGGVLKQKTVCV